MAELLSAKEIDDIIAQLSSFSDLSIIDVTPREIDRMENELQKMQFEMDFDLINEIYVKPLEDLYHVLNHKYNVKYVYSLNEYSIKERLKIIQRSLQNFGLTVEQILDLVPKSSEEISIIAKAIEKGYKSQKVSNNKFRVQEAQEYLESLSDNEENNYKL